MTDDSSSRFGVDRRGFLGASAAAAGAAALPGLGGVAGASHGDAVDEQLDLSADGLREVIVVFDGSGDPGRLAELDLQSGLVEYEALPMAYTALTNEQVRAVGGWNSVRRVAKSVELEFFNDDARDLLGADAVQSDLGYDGSGVDVAVIDSGFSGPHEDFDGRLESNWQWVDEPLESRDASWQDLGASADTDDLGHGTHCAGIVAGDGSASGGRYRGMAPGARISVYSTNATVYLPYAIGAWDHLLARVDDPDDDFSPAVVSNSYGVARDVQYNPNDPLNVATWKAFERGILPVFAAGNSGPDADTLSRFGKAPHVLTVAATNDGKRITDFSSRGRTPDEDRETNYDRRRALRNLEKFQRAMESGQRLVDVGTWAGEVGPAADSGTTGTDASTASDFHEWRAPNNADALELTLDVDPDGQHVRVSVHEGSRDGTVIAQMGEEPVHQHRTLTTDISGGTTYYVEVEPMVSVVVEYSIDYEGVEELGGEPERYRPVGLYRPGVATPGDSIVSTVGPTDSLDALEPDTEPLYTPMTGTSMACPAAAGVSVLLFGAARDNGYDPSPIDAINTIEATAAKAHEGYTPWNAGAGFVDAKAVVERAAAGDFADFGEVSLATPEQGVSLSVSGSRSDDGSAFTGGQTDEVQVSVDSVSHAATIRDTIPAEWSVEADYGDVDRVETEGDVKRVYLAGEVAADGSASFRYFAEAPSGAENTGEYTFGPAEAHSDATDDGWVAFGSTDSNTVVGEET